MESYQKFHMTIGYLRHRATYRGRQVKCLSYHATGYVKRKQLKLLIFRVNNDIENNKIK